MAAQYIERIGARIRARREELGLSRPKLVALMPGVVTENDLYRWERGQHRPHDDKLQALAGVLKVDTAYFLAPEPEPGTPDLLQELAGGPSQLDRIEHMLAEVLERVAALEGAQASGDEDPVEAAKESATRVVAEAADRRAPRPEQDAATPARRPRRAPAR